MSSNFNPLKRIKSLQAHLVKHMTTDDKKFYNENEVYKLYKGSKSKFESVLYT